ncbi:hypothetical protein KGQ19_48325, partial [Catenulispora sp. NL8]
MPAASFELAGAGVGVGVPDALGVASEPSVLLVVGPGVAELLDGTDGVDGAEGVGCCCGGGCTVTVPATDDCPTSVRPVGPSITGTANGWAGVGEDGRPGAEAKPDPDPDPDPDPEAEPEPELGPVADPDVEPDVEPGPA